MMIEDDEVKSQSESEGEDQSEIHDDEVESVGDSDEVSEEPEFAEESETEEEDEDGEEEEVEDDVVSEKMGDEEEEEEEEGEEEGEEKEDVEPEPAQAGPSSGLGVAGGRVSKRKKQRNPRKWIKEVRAMQESPGFMIPRAPFRLLVREIAQDYGYGFKFTVECFNALQTASEEHVTEVMAKANLQCIHRGRVTIEPKDTQMARHMMNLI
jgi:histone H3/H4